MLPKINWRIEGSKNETVGILLTNKINCPEKYAKSAVTILITKDTFERIKADIVNIKSEDFYEKVVPQEDEQYTGRMEVYISAEKLSEFYAKKVISKADVVCYLEDSDEYFTPDLYVNQFLVMYSLENKKQSALGRFDGTNIVNLHYKRGCLLNSVVMIKLSLQ